jgi:hypothetical protein
MRTVLELTITYTQVNITTDFQLLRRCDQWIQLGGVGLQEAMECPELATFGQMLVPGRR